MTGWPGTRKLKHVVVNRVISPPVDELHKGNDDAEEGGQDAGWQRNQDGNAWSHPIGCKTEISKNTCWAVTV